MSMYPLQSTNGKYVDYFGRQIEIGDKVAFAEADSHGTLQRYKSGIVAELITWKNELKEDRCKLINVQDRDMIYKDCSKMCDHLIIIRKYNE